MSKDPNLPAGLPWDSDEDRKRYTVKMKECPYCRNLSSYGYCEMCNDEGEIEMTEDDIREEIEMKKEESIPIENKTNN
mgnify:CR=1 FL=1